MALFRCIKDNQHDGIQGYRKGSVYRFSANPNASFFTLIPADVADKLVIDWTPLPAYKDLQEDWHVDVPVQFEGSIKINGSIVIAITDASSDLTVYTNDGISVIEVTTGAIDVDISLPPVADNTGRLIEVSKIDAGAGEVTFTGTINGDGAFIISFQYSNARLYCNGTEWHIK